MTNRARNQFIQALTDTGNVSEAARAIGMSRQRLYEYREEDEAFKEEWDEAIEYATDALEKEARRRALEGWQEPVFYRGDVAGYVVKYSDRMLELLLKAHRPAKYRDNYKGEDDNIEGVVTRLSDILATMKSTNGHHD